MMSEVKTTPLSKLPRAIDVQAQALAALHRICFELPWQEQSFKELLQLPSTIGWVCPDGFLLCSHTFDEMEILTICSHPDKRRQGVAKALLNNMMSYADFHNVQKIFLEVSDENEAAKSLYKSFGFEANGRRKNYYKTKHGQIDALCLIKRL